MYLKSPSCLCFLRQDDRHSFCLMHKVIPVMNNGVRGGGDVIAFRIVGAFFFLSNGSNLVLIVIHEQTH